MKQNLGQKSQKTSIFLCEKCEYKTDNKKDYSKHLLTSKHKINVQNGTNETPETDDLSNNLIKLADYICCYCKKNCNSRTTLWRHKKICSLLDIKEQNVEEYKTPITDKQLIDILVEQVKGLREENKELIELIKNGTHNTINTNCNNKTFNLQLFLNETCKDAMNIMEFVDSIKLQLTDLESVGQLGYVKGISNIIVKNLKALDVTKRPVHCSDVKREVLYIKDNNKWEKEDPENNKLSKAIKYISHKNILLLSKWREKYPDSQLSDSPQSDKYHSMVMEAMGGEGSSDIEKMNKIIRNIAKEVVIDK